MKRKIIIFLAALFLTGCAAKKPNLEVLPKSNIPANESIDTRGKTITTYIIFKAYKKLEKMNAGEVLEITTDNYEAIESDIKAWARTTGNNLVSLEKFENYQRYYIKKGTPKEKNKKLAMVISDPGLLELLTPLGLALGAALENTEVYMFVQGPAVEVLRKGFKGDLKGLAKPFSMFPRDGLNKVGHIPPQEKIKQLKELGAKFYICAPSMDHFGVKKEELIFDDIILSEYLTFMEVMGNADIHVFSN